VVTSNKQPTCRVSECIPKFTRVAPESRKERWAFDDDQWRQPVYWPRV